MDVAVSLVTRRNARTHIGAYKKPIGGRQLTSMDESEFGILSTYDEDDEGRKRIISEKKED